MRNPTKTRLRALILAGVGTAMLAACGGGGGVLSRERPDEFAVQRQTPLIIPPDFALTPPKPGEPRPAERSLEQQTLDALFGGPAARSKVESNTISRAGDAAPGIRSNVGDRDTNTVAKGRVTRDIIAAPEGDGREAQTSAGG
ncbi:MAG: DUF3035 domain-containing protein [Novosphingobium sp.]|nr:DUF3035 domain-containing protein [Novosphingobium sp.]